MRRMQREDRSVWRYVIIATRISDMRRNQSNGRNQFNSIIPIFLSAAVAAARDRRRLSGAIRLTWGEGDEEPSLEVRRTQ